MTGVYSGGLVYEYTEEADNPGFGLVNVASATAVTEKPDFTNLMNELSSNPSPSGDGGYTASTQVLSCPAQDANWAVSSDALPAMPAGAKKYLTQGAGTGPGLTGAGSQNAGGASTGTATAGTGQVTATGTSSASSTAKALAAGLDAPCFGKTILGSGFAFALSALFGIVMI